MIPSELLDHRFEAQLHEQVQQQLQQPPLQWLHRQGVLHQLCRDLLLQTLRQQVAFTPEEWPQLLQQLWAGLPDQPPAAADPGGAWIAELPEPLQAPLRERWDQLRLTKWLELSYAEQLEPYFLERRPALERVVYGLIRLHNQGLAEELFLRLMDDEADFCQLAQQHSLGDERFTRGIVGPMPISQPHPQIRAALQRLSLGEIHPPFALDGWIILLRMEHREPARLDDPTRLQLLQELLQRDLNAAIEPMVADLLTSDSLQAAAALPPAQP